MNTHLDWTFFCQGQIRSCHLQKKSFLDIRHAKLASAAHLRGLSNHYVWQIWVSKSKNSWYGIYSFSWGKKRWSVQYVASDWSQTLVSGPFSCHIGPESRVCYRSEATYCTATMHVTLAVSGVDRYFRRAHTHTSLWCARGRAVKIHKSYAVIHWG